MMERSASAQPCTLVAIDMAKSVHEVLVEPPTGGRKRWRVRNCQPDFVALRDQLRAMQTPVLVGFEATGNYHRPLAYYLGQCGFDPNPEKWAKGNLRNRSAAWSSSQEGSEDGTPVDLPPALSTDASHACETCCDESVS
ncbi:MAG: transposase [Nitrospira sp.]|nr:transposase [Nitrospira sp.]MCW5780232.1 transposase [Nitrospira sp.]